MQAGYRNHMHETGAAERNVQSIVPVQVAPVSHDQSLDKARRFLWEYTVRRTAYRICETVGKREDCVLMSDTKYRTLDRSCQVNIPCGITVCMSAVSDIGGGDPDSGRYDITAGAVIESAFRVI